MTDPDYASMTRRGIDDIRSTYRYHSAILQWSKKALEMILVDPQEAFEAVISFRAFDLITILEADPNQTDLMFTHTWSVLAVFGTHVPTIHADIVQEYKEIFRARKDASRNNENTS